MRWRHIFSCLLALAPAMAALPAEDEGVIEEGGERAGIAGAVSLSDGSLLRGKLSLSAGKRLRVYDLRNRRAFYLDLERIEAIRTFVEDEKLEEAWAFEEEGFRRKVKLGWRYPLRRYRQEIQLDSGQVIEGHCHAAVLYVDDGSRERKVILPRVQKGKRGQTLEDLVYPRSILCGDSLRNGVTSELEAKPFAELRGRIAGLSALTLMAIASRKGYPAAVLEGGEFVAGGLLPEAYAVFVRRGREIAVGLPPEPAIGATDREAIEGTVAGLAEFFEERRVVLLGGERRRPWILLELRRRGGTTLGAGGRSARVLRWELWCLERREPSWKVTSRVFLDRQLIPPGKELPEIDYRRDPLLWGLRLKSGKNRLPARGARARPNARLSVPLR